MTTTLFSPEIHVDGDALAEYFDPTPDPFVEDPVGWVSAHTREHLWSKQREIAASVVEHRYTAVRASHDVSKSHTASRLACWWLDVHPIGDAFVVSTAPTTAQVEAILWREIGKAHRLGNLAGRITHGQIPMWKVGDEIVAYGRKPQDLSSPEEAMQAFQGIHARYVLVILDEAGGIPKWLWDAVDTLATNKYARVLAIGNPDDPASQFEKVFRPGSGWQQIHISAFDTPAFTGEKVPEDLLDVLVSQEWVEERKKRWGEGSPLYKAKVLGEFPEVSDDTLISPALIRAAQERSLPGLGAGRYAGDVARMGKDETVAYRNRDGVLRLEYRGHKQDTMVTAGAFGELIRPHQGGVPMVIDIIGVGSGVYDRLAEQELAVIPFQGSEQAYNPRRFKNRRAETYWGFRIMMEEGLIDIAADDDDLAAQLGSIKYKIDSAGRIQIESKDDMKKRGLPSPDRADAAVMSTIVTDWNNEDLDEGDRHDTLTGDLLERKF